MNKKGFAISGMIYAILVLFLIMVFSILSILGSRKLTFDKLKKDVLTDLNQIVDSTYDFTYTGKIQPITLKPGVYKLEVWGAQGGDSYVLGDSNYRGGYGGYSQGEITLNEETTLYVVVGGSGSRCVCKTSQNCCGENGGFNGGGKSLQYTGGNTYYGSGGGATHIATKTGELSSLSDSLSDVLIVAGGGGGASNWLGDSTSGYNHLGGNAGGYVGMIGTYSRTDRSNTCTGGSQTAAGTGNYTTGNGFGLGGYAQSLYGPGSGAGLFGGGDSETSSCGGSGYVGNNLLKNKSMYCYECSTSNDSNMLTKSGTEVSSDAITNHAKKGNGYARITLISNISEPNAPELLTNMVPVYYDNDNSTWRKANSSNVNNQWYDYNNKKWANAVILNNGTTKEVGDEIAESDIALWYVWIPRYKYTIFNGNNESVNEQLINVSFENGTNSTGTVKCVNNTDGSETCTDATNGSIVNGTSTYTHPAFTFGDNQLTGFWVGKFEVSTTDSTCNSNTSKDNCNKVLTINIKPNVSSWRYTNVSNFFTSIQNTKTTYGITDADSHMIKNMEWGAVAYLKQSGYGLGSTDIGINNNSNYITGCGAAAGSSQSTTCNAYNTTDGMLASTTGNIYGVYDMSGGSWEYVMGNMLNESNAFYSSSAGFTTTPASKYYDTYKYDTYGSNSSVTHARGKLGDAAKETLLTFGSDIGGWHSDYAHFPDSTRSWFLRGGNHFDGSHTGVFSFYSNVGQGYYTDSARAILSSPTMTGTLVIDGTLGNDGWYVSDVKLSVDDIEGMKSTLNINEITTDTAGTDVIVTTTNTETGAVATKTYTIKVDKTKPTVGTATFTGTMGSNNWYTSNVTVNVANGSDSLSGHKSTTSSISSITSDTKGTTVTVITTDNAGNQATRTYNIKVDKTKPTAGTLTISGTKGENDWYLSDVTFTINNGSDATSGHNSTTSSHTKVTGNTTGTKVTVTTKDNAGNTATRTYTIKIDKTKPTIANIKAKGYVGGNTVTGTLSDSNTIAGYYITSSSTYACSGTTPTSWTSASGTSYSLSSNTTASGTTYIWVKDKAGNTNCTSKTLYRLYFSTIETTTCAINSVSSKDNNGLLNVSLEATCACAAQNTCKSDNTDYGTDSARASAGFVVYGSTETKYTVGTVTKSRNFQELQYDNGSHVLVYSNSVATVPKNKTLLLTAGYGRTSTVNTVGFTVSKIIADSTTIYNSGFQEY